MEPVQISQLFYQPPNDNNFYHITFKPILQISENGILQLSENLEDNYDYEFFYDANNYHVTCKLFPRSLIIDILNKEIYGIDFNVNDLRHKHTLTLKQKINLEKSLIQEFPFLQEQILKSDFKNTSIDQILTPQQALQLNELRLFYQPPGDINIYNVTCKIILQDYHQNDDDNYDYEFFYQIPDDIRHVTCKFLPPSLIIDCMCDLFHINTNTVVIRKIRLLRHTHYEVRTKNSETNIVPSGLRV
ncbi:hypothetical protein RhiirA4_421919 [Rhizophagus irregularis]|uniref:Uncharacterized protein n=1 Tax=Rhizophagus irregularis TaxID=588596 RepID=A0A2I1GNI3_9GLOM|nr:hypothetical protein RhiirA4_421919 [Rhizophagus irregularis]